MKRCLLCGRNTGETTVYDALFSDDLLCLSCRSGWQKRKLEMELAGLKLESSYVYNGAFSSALVQYKEMGDEAIADIFMHVVRKRFIRRYRGYTLVPMPSSEEKRRARGFDHVRGMFACTGLPMVRLFEKTGEGDQKSRSKKQRGYCGASM